MHDECLTKDAKRLFPRLANFHGYHLVGRTALALQIGHRVSYDFDLFTEKELSKDLFKKVQKIFFGEKRHTVFRSKEQYDLIVSGVKTTFRFYPYQAVYPYAKHHKVPLLSIKDIAASKAFAIGQRAAYRDYVDMYFLLEEAHATLSEIIALSEKKYRDEFNGRLFLEQLVYLGDITDTKVDFLRDPVSKSTMVKRLKSHVRQYIRSL